MEDILHYISSYDDVRAVLGLPIDELSDATLALEVYKDCLGLALEGTAGIYPTGEAEETLDEIFDRLATTDSMYSSIRLFALYTVADCVANALPMIGVKTKSDGKSTVIRHSAESVYLSTQARIKKLLNRSRISINDLFGNTTTSFDSLTVVVPATDPVTGG